MTIFISYHIYTLIAGEAPRAAPATSRRVLRGRQQDGCHARVIWGGVQDFGNPRRWQSKGPSSMEDVGNPGQGSGAAVQQRVCHSLFLETASLRWPKLGMPCGYQSLREERLSISLLCSQCFCVFYQSGYISPVCEQWSITLLQCRPHAVHR